MSAFADQMLLKFLQEAFVDDLLKNQLGLPALFNLTYEVAEIEVKEIALTAVTHRQFQMPIFETIRTAGTEERILPPPPERIQLNRVQPRYGRLAWVDVFLEILLTTKVHDKIAPIEKITLVNLLEKLGAVASMNELRNKLKTLYPESVVAAFFKELRIGSVEEFKRRGNFFLEFVYKTPPAFDPNDPQNARSFRLNVCAQFQPELKIAEALQTAKLSRSIMENEKEFAEAFEGGEIKTPYAFVVIFPESAAADNAIPGLAAAQIKDGVKSLFAAEKMLAHFVTET